MINLFIIGAPKCGTTSIYHYLNQHPNIDFGLEKEPHYFCSDLHLSSDKYHNKKLYYPYRNQKDYHALYDFNNKKIKCFADGSTSNFYSNKAAENILNYNPKAKIIIMLREPISMAYSWYNYLFYHLEETETSFTEVLKGNLKRRYNHNLKTPERLNYYSIINFNLNIKRFYSFFNSNQIQIILFDDFILNPKKSYEKILNFINVLPDDKQNFEKHNENRSYKSELIRNFFVTYRTSFIKKVLNFIIPRKYYLFASRNLRNFTTMAGKTTTIDVKMHEKLKKAYKNNVIKLSETLNFDFLKIWRY